MRRKILLLVFISAIGICHAPQAAAGEETTGDYFRGIGSKFGRGLVNVVTSPVEIPCAMADEMAERPATGFFTGLGKGLGFMLRRLLVGVDEILTFFIPMEPDLPVVCQEAPVSS